MTGMENRPLLTAVWAAGIRLTGLTLTSPAVVFLIFSQIFFLILWVADVMGLVLRRKMEPIFATIWK